MPELKLNEMISFGKEIPAHLYPRVTQIVEKVNVGYTDELLPECEQILKELKETLGEHDSSIGTLYNIFGLIYRNKTERAKALELLNAALAVRRQTHGEKHEYFATTLNSLSILYLWQGNMELAYDMCKRATSIYNQLYGKKHPQFAMQMNNLAVLYHKQGKFKDAEKYFRYCLDLYRKKLVDPIDPKFSVSKYNLVNCFMDQLKFKEANELCEQLSDYESSYDSIRQKPVTASSVAVPDVPIPVPTKTSTSSLEQQLSDQRIELAKKDLELFKAHIIIKFLGGACKLCRIEIVDMIWSHCFHLGACNKCVRGLLNEDKSKEAIPCPICNHSGYPRPILGGNLL